MNIFHKVLELWPGHESGTYGRTDRRTDVRTDGRTGRTGVTLNALPLTDGHWYGRTDVRDGQG